MIDAQRCDRATDCEPRAPRQRPKPAYAHDALAIKTCAQGYYYAPWTVGQDVQLATGQGLLEASPMQMALAYSAIVNGGTVWRPQIGEAIDSPSGQLVQELPAPTVARHVTINPADRAVVMEGLHDAAQSPPGPPIRLRQLPVTVYGKTGTPCTAGQEDQSWYVVYVPDGRRSMVSR